MVFLFILRLLVGGLCWLIGVMRRFWGRSIERIWWMMWRMEVGGVVIFRLLRFGLLIGCYWLGCGGGIELLVCCGGDY